MLMYQVSRKSLKCESYLQISIDAIYFVNLSLKHLLNFGKKVHLKYDHKIAKKHKKFCAW